MELNAGHFVVIILVLLFIAVALAAIISGAFKAMQPHCKECRQIVNRKATKCRHCGSHLS